jgi:hypothetical protein
MALIDLFQLFARYDQSAYEVFFPANTAATEAEVTSFTLGLALPEEYNIFLTTPLAGLTVTASVSGRRLHVLSLPEVRDKLADFPA